MSFEQNYIGAWDIFYEQPLAVNKPDTVWHGLTLTIAADSLTLAEAAASDPEVIYTVSDIAADANGGYTFKAQGGDLTWTAHIVLFAEDNAIKAEGTPAEGAAQTAVFIKDGVSPEFAPSGLESTEWETADKASTLSIGEDGDIFFGEDPVFLLTCTDGADGTHSFTGIYHADYVTGTLSSEAVSLTVGGTTYAFAPKAASITFPVDFQDEWTEMGGTDEIVIDKTTLTYNSTAYDVTKETGLPGFTGDVYSFVKDGNTHYLAFGADGYILQLFIDDGEEGTWKIFEGTYGLPDLALKTFDTTFINRSYVGGDEMPTITIDAAGKMKIGDDSVKIIYNDIAENNLFYLIWSDAYYTVMVSENGSALDFSDLTGNEFSFTAGFSAAQQGEWHLIGTTIPSLQYTLQVNKTTATVNGTESTVVSYTDEYGTDNAYYTFKVTTTDSNSKQTTTTYVLYFLSADTAVLRMGNNFFLYNKSAETVNLVFPEEYCKQTWISETSTCNLGAILIDADGNAFINGQKIKILAIVETTTYNALGSASTVKTVHVLYNNSQYFTFALGKDTFTITSQQQTTQKDVYVPLAPGPIESGDVADYQGTWKFFGEDDKTVIIDAQGNLTYDGEQCGVLKTHDGSYTFAAGGTSYTLGLTYIVNDTYYLMFVSYADDEEYVTYEYYTKDGGALPNAGGIPSTYDGEYTYSMDPWGPNLTLTIADGKMSISRDGAPMEFSVDGVESNAGEHIAVAYLDAFGYCDVTFSGNTVTIISAVAETSMGTGELVFTKVQKGFPDEIAGTWTQINSADDGYTITITKGEETFTIQYGTGTPITATLISFSGTEFTFTMPGVEGELTANILGDNAFIYYEYYDKALEENYPYFFATSEWEMEPIAVDAKYQGEWKSIDEKNTLTIDETGMLTWTGENAVEPVMFGIFYMEGDMAYALDLSMNAYRFTFSDTMIEMTELASAKDYSFLGHTGSTGDSVNVPDWFEGTWKMYGGEDSVILTVAVVDDEGTTEVTFTVDGPTSAETVTATEADDNGFTFQYQGSPVTVEWVFDDNTNFLFVDMGFGPAAVFVLEDAFTDLGINDANVKNTTWKSDDQTLTIDGNGKIKLDGQSGHIIKVVYSGFSGNILSEAYFLTDDGTLYALKSVDDSLVLSLYGDDADTTTFTKA